MHVLLRSLFALAAALIGFVAGGVAASAFLVPAGSGLAGPAIAVAWALGAATGALVAAIFVGSRLSPRSLRIATAVTAAAAAAAIGYIAAVFTAAQVSAAQGSRPKTPVCGGDESLQAAALSGEVAAGDAFSEAVNGWTFTLQPQPHGWLLSLLAADGRDLTAVTPPFHGPNPRQLDGWHFRNADNTAANDGSVNAPQHLRQFQFAPSIEGTGGFRPPRGDAPVEAEGQGWLFIEEMELADLEPGRQARIARLRFAACLTWPKAGALGGDAADRDATAFVPEEVERFAACGLRPPYELSAWITPRQLDGDLDGDGALDAVATVVRATDGARGLAVCRAGTHLDLLGFAPLDELAPAYLAQVEAWTVKPRRQVIEYAGNARPLPPLEHDIITIERIEKSSYTLYWNDGAFHARLDYRVVTQE